MKSYGLLFVLMGVMSVCWAGGVELYGKVYTVVRMPEVSGSFVRFIAQAEDGSELWAARLKMKTNEYSYYQGAVEKKQENKLTFSLGVSRGKESLADRQKEAGITFALLEKYYSDTGKKRQGP